jgi:hypothetical protein
MRRKLYKAQEGAQVDPQMQAQAQQQQMQQLVMQMAEQLKQGNDPAMLIQQLVEQGMPEEQAEQLIDVASEQAANMEGMAPPKEAQPQGQEATPEGQPMMQDGGETKQQEQMMQLIQMFAQIQGVDPNQIMEQLQGASPEEQQQMMQQMVQTVQESQGGGQGQPQAAQMQQPPMASYGGIAPEFNPNNPVLEKMMDGGAKDFNKLKNEMIKSYRDGGKVDESMLDESSTNAYVTGLRNSLQKALFAGYAANKVKRDFEQTAADIDQMNQMMKYGGTVLPKAQDGIEVADDGVPFFNVDLGEYNEGLKKYGINSIEELNALDPEKYSEIVNQLNKDIFDQSDIGKNLANQGITYEDISNRPEEFTNATASYREQMTTAEGVTDLDLQMNNMTREQYDALPLARKKDIVGSAAEANFTAPAKPPKKKEPAVGAVDGDDPNNTDPGKDDDPKFNVGDRQEWDGEKWVTVKGTDTNTGGDPNAGQVNTKQNHYYPGQYSDYGRRTLSGRSMPNFLTTPLGQSIANMGVTRTPTGNVQVKGFGDYAGWTPEQIDEAVRSGQIQVSAMDDVRRKGIFGREKRRDTDWLGRSNVIGKRVYFGPTGQPMQGQPGQAGAQQFPQIGTGQGQGQQFPQIGTGQGQGQQFPQINQGQNYPQGMQTMEMRTGQPTPALQNALGTGQPTSFNDLLAQHSVSLEDYESGKINPEVKREIDSLWNAQGPNRGRTWQPGDEDFKGVGKNLATNPRTGEQRYVSERKAERWGSQGSEQNNTTATGESPKKTKMTRAQKQAQKGQAKRDRAAFEKIEAQENAEWAEIDAYDDQLRKDDLSAMSAEDMSRRERRELKKLVKKYPSEAQQMMYGGNVGALVWDPQTLRFIQQTERIPFAENGMVTEEFDPKDFDSKSYIAVKPEYQKEVNVGAYADAAYFTGLEALQGLRRLNRTPSREEQLAMQSVHNQFNPLAPNSLDEGLYRKNDGQQAVQDRVVPLAGTNQPWINQGRGMSSDVGAAEGALIKAKAGMQVGEEMVLNNDQIKMLEGLGYKIKQLY